MFPFNTWHESKSLRLISLGIIVHVSIFYGVLDVYFSSPVEPKLVAHKANFSLADRLVVFIADGLRYEALDHVRHDKNTPFLNNIRRDYGTWGVSNTRVPTESRPGHVAIFSGMYEDPSALLNGWKRNPISIDNVFNHSKESWLWGSPDVVPMFNPDNRGKIHTFHYDSHFEDFSGRTSTIELDKWVFGNVKRYCNGMRLIRLVGQGRIFFLHLLGMDTAGHVFKPNSKEYVENLQFVDDGIQEMYFYFQTIFPDDRTAFIFTSDHGMTDWGSHGGGSDHETQSPFIAWGSGIRRRGGRRDLSQVDAAPLMSALLGINFPTNSIGLVPVKYLDTSYERRVLLLYANMEQLAEKFHKKHNRLQRTSIFGFFKPFEALHKGNFDRKIADIHRYIARGFNQIAEYKIRDLIKTIREGEKYIDQYYKYPFLFALSVGIISWMFYLILHIIPSNDREFISSKYISRLLFNYIVVLFGLALALQRLVVHVKYRFYMFFPTVMLIPVFYETNKLIGLVVFLYKVVHWSSFVEVIVCGLGFSSLIFSFYYESYIVLPVIFLFLWAVENRNFYSNGDIALWTALPLLIYSYSVFSKMKDFSALLTVCSYFLISHVLLVRIKNISNQFTRDTTRSETIHCYVLVLYLLLTTACTSLVMIYTIYGIPPEFWQLVICSSSWFLLCLTFAMAIFSPSTFLNRIFDMGVLLNAIFTTMTNSGESLFLTLFICLQLQWTFMELYKFDKQFGGTKWTQPRAKEPRIENFRRCMFFIYFILLSYFGAGNTANMNTFDPMWARQYVMVFNPFLSAVIILFKITIPFLITTISFQTINTYTGTPTITLFSIIMLCCDIFVLYFMYTIKNEGSWLQIGLSISRFVIVSVMTIVLLLFYGLAKLLARNTLSNALMAYLRGNNQYQQRNVEP